MQQNWNIMTNSSTPKWFMPVAIIAVIWNLMGLGAFFGEISKSAEAIAALPELERALYENLPLWAKIAFALAVFGGTIGSIGLALKKKWSRPVLLISLCGIVVQMFHSLVIAKTTAVYGPGSVVMPIMIILIGVALVWLSRKADTEGWLS